MPFTEIAYRSTVHISVQLDDIECNIFHPIMFFPQTLSL